ncbi:MAG TPA: sporulation protein YqfD [Firmicutes bacterium]|nr:sporulation protein YqfD [Bacillota bacterium]
MLFERIFLLLVGYLSIRFQGRRVERFINLCLQEEIPVWDIYTTRNGMVVGKTSITGFKQMRLVARRSGVRVRIIRRRGLPFLLARLWKRTAFVCGAFLFILSLYVLGSIVWFVEVKGNEEVPTATVLQAAAELGLRPGVYRKHLVPSHLSRSLAIKLPELSWVGVEMKGSCAVIEVVEKQLVTRKEKPFGHVVAAKSGVITKIVATHGKAMVKAGDTVEQGQILISGAFSADEDAEVRYVHAEGITEANIWYDGIATSSKQRVAQVRTGRQVISEVLVLGDKELVFAGPAAPPFMLYEEDCQDLPLFWRDIGLAVEHRRRIYFEVVEEMQSVSLEEAAAEAARAAEELALAKLPEAVEPTATHFREELLPDQNTVRVQAIIETVESIGEFVALVAE